MENEPKATTSDKGRERPPYLRLVRLPLTYPYPDDTLTVAGEIAHEKLMAALRDIRRTK